MRKVPVNSIKSALAFLAVTTICLPITACSNTNTGKNESILPNPFTSSKKHKSTYKLDKPLVWKHNKLKVVLHAVSRSEVHGQDGNRLMVHLLYSGIPKGINMNLDSFAAKDSAGRELDAWGYDSSSSTDQGSVEVGFQLPERQINHLSEFSGVFDSSYVIQRNYGPYTVDELKKPFVSKDKMVAMSLHDWQVMKIPYEIMSPAFFHYTADGSDTESLVKELPDEQHGYFILRYYGIEKDEMIDRPSVSVYGSDGKWHKSFFQEGTVYPIPDFDSNAVYLGFQVDADIFTGGKKPAKILSVDGPAAEAGMQIGDIITRLGSRKIGNANSLICMNYTEIRPGKTLPVTVLRNGKEIELQIVPIQNPIWSGMSAAAARAQGEKLRKLVGAESDWYMYGAAFIVPDPVPLGFKPLKVKIVRGETVKATKTIPFKFRNVPLPAKLWSVK